MLQHSARRRQNRLIVSQQENVPDTLRDLAGIVWRLLVVGAGLAVLGILLGKIAPVAFALFFAMLVTAWASPIMNLLRKIMPKVLAMLLALLVIAAGVVAIFVVVVRATISEAPKFAEAVTSGFQDIEQWLRTGPLQMSDTRVNDLLTQAGTAGKHVASGVLGDALGAFGSIGTLIIAGSVFIFGVIFFMLSPQTIWGWFIGWMPKKLAPRIDTGGRIAWDSIAGYTRGIIIVALCDATLVFLGLTIMRVPLAPALAALVFLGAFIPVIGAPVATFFAAVVALAERGPVIALLVVLLTIVVGSFDGDVLQPLVMGKAVNLHPLAIVFAIAAGSIVLGIIGALIAVPIAGAFYGIAKYVTNRDPEHPYPPPPLDPVAST